MPTKRMKYPRFGQSGLRTSQVILGCMGFGSSQWQPWVLDEAEALPLLAHAWERGLTTWDTADVYSNGRSEEIIGEAIRQYGIPREELVILSKCYFAVQPGYPAASKRVGPADAGPELVNQVGLSRKHILAAVDASVKRLGTYIDVLQIHRLDQDTPREEIMRALNDVVESGKVRYLGASSMPAWEFQALQNMAERHGWHKFVSMQNYHHLLYREEEREMIPYCHHTGVAVLPWSPVAHGVLTRPWGERAVQHETDNHLIKLIRSCETEIDKAIVGRVEELARRLGVSMMGVVTAWSISKGVTPIIGLSSKERIDQAVNNIHIKLSDEQIQYLEELYVPKPVQDY